MTVLHVFSIGIPKMCIFAFQLTICIQSMLQIKYSKNTEELLKV